MYLQIKILQWTSKIRWKFDGKTSLALLLSFQAWLPRCFWCKRAWRSSKMLHLPRNHLCFWPLQEDSLIQGFLWSCLDLSSRFEDCNEKWRKNIYCELWFFRGSYDQIWSFEFHTDEQTYIFKRSISSRCSMENWYFAQRGEQREIRGLLSAMWFQVWV